MPTTFPKPSKADWLARVEKDLKGKPLSSLNFTLAGQAYSPFHHPEDRPAASPPIDGMPTGHRLVGVEIDARKDAEVANEIALDALNRGADLIVFVVPYLDTLAKGTRRQLLAGILTDIVTILFAERLYDDPSAPLLIQQGEGYHVDALSGDYADALYSAVESYVEDGVHTPVFHVAATNDYFHSIASLRALRLCWQRASQACGQQRGCVVYGHVKFSSDTDANHNKIEATTKAMSLLIGGANGLIVAPSDRDGTAPFSRRVALNLQHVLEYESHLQEVPDPAAGSYFLERLTDDLAQQIWAKFQRLTTDSSYNI